MPDELPLGRLEAFSDGVFAIAITLLALTAFVRYAAENRRLVADDVEAEAVEAALVHQPSFLFYGIGIGVSLLAPTLGIAFYLVTSLYIGIPGRTIHRLLRGRRPA